MDTYTIYKIDSHFKLFYNFKTKTFSNRELNLTIDNFNSSKAEVNRICNEMNYIENLKSYGAQQYAHVNTRTLI